MVEENGVAEKQTHLEEILGRNLTKEEEYMLMMFIAKKQQESDDPEVVKAGLEQEKYC